MVQSRHAKALGRMGTLERTQDVGLSLGFRIGGPTDRRTLEPVRGGELESEKLDTMAPQTLNPKPRRHGTAMARSLIATYNPDSP